MSLILWQKPRRSNFFGLSSLSLITGFARATGGNRRKRFDWRSGKVLCFLLQVSFTDCSDYWLKSHFLKKGKRYSSNTLHSLSGLRCPLEKQAGLLPIIIHGFTFKYKRSCWHFPNADLLAFLVVCRVYLVLPDLLGMMVSWALGCVLVVLELVHRVEKILPSLRAAC